MSRTFTSRPSGQTRGRGGQSTRGRGSQPQCLQSGDSPKVTDPGGTRGRRGRSSSERLFPTASPVRSNRGHSLMRGSSVSRGRGMDRPGPSNMPSDDLGKNRDSGQPGESQSGQHVGAFTMFAPNEKKRQEIARMAQRETAAYEEYKKQNAGKVYSHVGTTGGGELTESQVRARQANENRAQKFNRQVKQHSFKETLKRAEDEQIEAKKAEARRKAEQNEIRERKAPAADDVRRNREAFLRQFEGRAEAVQFGSQSPDKGAKSRSPPSNTQSQSRYIPSTTVNAARVDVSDRFNSTEQHRPDRRLHHEPNTSTVSEGGRDTSGNNSNFLQENSEEGSCAGLEILTAMFPDIAQDSLCDLLIQMGSTEAVIDMLT